jgi:hypothetical protein
MSRLSEQQETTRAPDRKNSGERRRHKKQDKTKKKHQRVNKNKGKEIFLNMVKGKSTGEKTQTKKEVDSVEGKFA